MAAKLAVARVGVFVLLLVALTACQREKATEHGSGHAGAHWSYDGETGPAHWGDLSPAFALCRTGKSQSPIDIAETQPAEGAPMEFHYGSCALGAVNNGHTIQMNGDGAGFIKVGAERYELQQFHFHARSEHTVQGAPYDMELHLVHQSAGGGLAVVGVFLREGAENAALAKFWGRLPAKSSKHFEDKDTQLGIADLLPADKSCYSYEGSLTTPPGTEGVKWFVMSKPAELSAAQLQTFRKLYDHNYRPTQPLNGRVVHEYKE